MRVEYNDLELEPEQPIVKYKKKFSMNEVMRLVFILSLPIIFTAFLISVEDVLPERKQKNIALGGSLKKNKKVKTK